jgi:hypothetical protein
MMQSQYRSLGNWSSLSLKYQHFQIISFVSMLWFKIVFQNIIWRCFLISCSYIQIWYFLSIKCCKRAFGNMTQIFFFNMTRRWYVYISIYICLIKYNQCTFSLCTTWRSNINHYWIQSYQLGYIFISRSQNAHIKSISFSLQPHFHFQSPKGLYQINIAQHIVSCSFLRVQN